MNCTRRLFRSIAVALALWSGIFTAVNVSAGSPDFLIDIWTSDDDLPDSSVTAVAQTPDGYLWIGTMNGLARFDGVRFVNFDPFNTLALKHARVTGLFVDSHGALWINTYDGSMTALRDGVFTHEWQGGKVEAVFSQPNHTYLALTRGELACRTGPHDATNDWQTINLIGSSTGTSFRQDSQGTLWFFTRDGVLGQVNGTNCQAITGDVGLRGTFVKDIVTDENGRIWVGTDKEIACWNGQRFEDQTPTNGEPDLNVTFFFCPSSNDCWVVANDKVRRCRDREWIAEYPSWQELTSANPTYIEEHLDSRERVWFRSYGLGLFYANPDGTARRLNSENGLPNNQVSCWLEDHEGNIWLGVGRGGLVRLREKRIQVIGATDGLQVPAISTVCEDPEGNIWFGTFGGGLYRWRDNALQTFRPSGRADLKSFFSTYPDAQNRLWLSAGKEDLHRLENGRISEMPDTAHGIKSLLVDRQDRVWIGRKNGLACWADDELTDLTLAGDFERIDVRAIAEDRQGRLWFGEWTVMEVRRREFRDVSARRWTEGSGHLVAPARRGRDALDRHISRWTPAILEWHIHPLHNQTRPPQQCHLPVAR